MTLPNSRYVPFRTLRHFPGDVARALAQLEQNILEKLENDNFRSFGPFKATGVRTTNTRALPWQIVKLNPTAGGFRVSLPSPREPDAGFIILKNVSSSTNPIDVRPIAGTIDGQASNTLSGSYEAMWLAPDPERNDWLPLCCADGAAGSVSVSDLTAGTPLPHIGIGYWEELFAEDFTALGNQAFATSGTPVTFAGVSWIPQAVSGGTNNGTINNVAGTGLQIACNGNSSTMNGSPTAPRLLLDMRELGPLAGLGEGPVRIRARVTLSPFASDFQFFYAGVSLIPQEAQNILAGIGYNSGDGGQTTTALIQHGGASADYFLNPEARGSKDVIDARFYAPWTMEVRFGEWTGAFPVVDRPQGTIASTQSSDISNDAFVQQRDLTLGAGAGNKGLYIELAAATNAPGVAFTATITHLTIDQWRNGS